jgi:predicted ATP-dependent endonuclease of OLD family
MSIKKLKLSNFTVFSELDMSFSQGINIFVGENGTGKTHIMKVLYAACQAARKDISFSQKIVKVFKPDDLTIKRLARKQGRKTGNSVSICINAEDENISMSFDNQTKKWDAEVKNEENWENKNTNLNSTYIPAKEILSNAWNFEAAVNKNNIDFDDTYVDIITSAKINVSKDDDLSLRENLLNKIKTILDGNVSVENDKFYLSKITPTRMEFNLVSEGIRKLALLLQLVKNGTLESGSVLFWDEPETNLNPRVIPTLVEILLELQRVGVQIFISTHDYVLSKYFEIRANDTDKIIYFSLYKNQDDSVSYNKCNNFRELRENPIISAYDKLLDEVLDKNMGD